MAMDSMCAANSQQYMASEGFHSYNSNQAIASNEEDVYEPYSFAHTPIGEEVEQSKDICLDEKELLYELLQITIRDIGSSSLAVLCHVGSGRT
jgi:hypothetical protein